MKKNVAQLISFITMPYFIALGTIFLLVKTTSEHSQALYWTIITILFTIVLPFSFVSIQIFRKKITNQNVDIRKQRIPVYILGIMSLLLGTITLFYLNAPHKLTLSLLTVSIIAIAAFLVTLMIHKTSAHMISISLSFSFLYMDYKLLVSFIFITMFLVAWSRFYLKKHTTPELLSGFLIGTIFPILIMHFYS